MQAMGGLDPTVAPTAFTNNSGASTVFSPAEVDAVAFNGTFTWVLEHQNNIYSGCTPLALNRDLTAL
jgi:hypothetical protein